MDPKYAPPKDYSHIAIGIMLLALAAVLYSVGYAWAGGVLVAIGVVTEVAAWALLMDGNRRMPKVEPPAFLANQQRQDSDKR